VNQDEIESRIFWEQIPAQK